jgi:hypothetical protein
MDGVFLKNWSIREFDLNNFHQLQHKQTQPRKLARLASPFVRRLRATGTDTMENSATSKIAKQDAARTPLARRRPIHGFTVVSK